MDTKTTYVREIHRAQLYTRFEYVFLIFFVFLLPFFFHVFLEYLPRRDSSGQTSSIFNLEFSLNVESRGTRQPASWITRNVAYLLYIWKNERQSSTKSVCLHARPYGGVRTSTASRPFLDDLRSTSAKPTQKCYLSSFPSCLLPPFLFTSSSLFP